MEELIEALKFKFDTNYVEYDPDNGYYVNGQQLEIVEEYSENYDIELDYCLDEYIFDLKQDLINCNFYNVIDCIDWNLFKSKFNLSDFGWESFKYKDNTYYYLNY